jgi:uncharacterized protein YkwD
LEVSRQLKTAALLGIAAAILVLPAQAGACPAPGSVPSEQSVDGARQSIRCLINKKRKKRHLRPLRSNAALQAAAQQHAVEMDSGNFFSHESPDGGDPLSRIKEAGYLIGASIFGVGETLGFGDGAAATPGSTVSAWMQSPSHRATMLGRRYRHIGIGIVIGSPLPENPTGVTYTADFAFRK